MDEKIAKIKNALGSGSINIFGLPYSGKDTLGKQLAEALGAKFISSGDVVRANSEKLRNSENSDLGFLTPTAEFSAVMEDYLKSQTGNEALILSSVGRWHGEEAGILQALTESGHELKHVIYLKISEEEIWRRWESAKKLGDRGRRYDDTSPENLRRRIDEFKEKTLPVIEYYQKMGLLIEVDGERDRNEVFADVVNILA